MHIMSSTFTESGLSRWKAQMYILATLVILNVQESLS